MHGLDVAWHTKHIANAKVSETIQGISHDGRRHLAFLNKHAWILRLVSLSSH